VGLALVAAELGLSRFHKIEQLDTLIQYQRDYGLVLSLSGYHQIPVQLTSEGFEETLDANGHLKRLCVGQPRWIDSTDGPVQLKTIRFIGETQVAVHSVIFERDEFSVVDETHMEPAPYLCPLSDVYVDKEDLVAFRDKEIQSIPGWADPLSDQHAPELALAIKLHKALRVDGAYPNEKVMVNRVNSWVLEHMPGEELGAAQSERIATIIGDASKQAWPKK
jgi:hypothetical protein